MDQELDIVVTGFDVSESQAARGLAQAFDLSPAQAERFVRDVPRIAKRRASREEAERFAQTLRALGARVETMPSAAPHPTVPARALTVDEPPFAHDPWSTDPPPADDMQFRGAGSLGMTSLHPEEVLNPAIPKAPLVPHDMHRMPNAVLPLPSLRPEEAGADPSGDPLHRHTDAQLPPPLVFVNADAPSLEPAAPSSAKPVVDKRAALPVEPPEPVAGAGSAAQAQASTAQNSSAKLATTAFVVACVAALALWLALRS